MLEGTTLGGSADASGRVTITDIPSGGQVILFSFVGYQTLKDTFEFPLSSTQPVTVLLSSEGTEAEQLPAW
jgi:iron complex outermembrane receptor protein